MTLTVRIPDDLAARLAALGASPERVALDALRHAADELERAQRAGAVARRSPAEAAARIRERRKGITLGGLTIKELISEGRP